ncbi:Nramp family divalent metal transporter [Pedobacter nyackensis]|uniref:Mn2+ and Fe2+ transporters of the NRAMP family n=1 Tax=Pedobacter nyackensis TaxID=475255 RepID=A0A1W1ZUH7_9SPHI|nr:Nramp family divalent metal transporter [Pedobacter nyackensis]SMC52099.1 Mn2+ and Fe2+ transporters of the NRAMP family [Pedobacter nyackensis]
MKNSVKKWLVSLGPGIVTAAIVFGPSKITITSKMGAMYGYSLLWVVVVAIFFMIVFTSIGSRIGMATDDSILTTIRKEYGKWVAGLMGVGIFLVTTSFQAGNSIGIGISLSEATGTRPAPWIILFNLISIALLFFRNFYQTLERLMIAIVALMLFAFLTTMFLVKPDISGIFTGFTPSFPHGSTGLVIAFSASCFSIVGAFYQAYLMQARQRINPGSVLENSKGFIGMIILGVMSAVVMICAAAVLNKQGIPVNKASDMALALEPLFGHNASLLFLVGLFGASFSSLVGNATIGGSLLSDGFGYGSQLDSKVVKGFIALVMVIGSVVAVGYEKPPLELIIFAQSITIFLVPFIGIAMYTLSNKRSLMGEHVNTPFARYAGFAGLLVLALLAIYNFYELFLK